MSTRLLKSLLKGDIMPKYSEKLKDPRWQRKRLEIFERDNFTCLGCGDTKNTLNCHHKQYHGDPWDAPNDSLETLCEECHEDRTALNKHFLSLPTSTTRLINNFINLGKSELENGFDIICEQHEYHSTSDRARKVKIMNYMVGVLEVPWMSGK